MWLLARSFVRRYRLPNPAAAAAAPVSAVVLLHVVNCAGGTVTGQCLLASAHVGPCGRRRWRGLCVGRRSRLLLAVVVAVV